MNEIGIIGAKNSGKTTLIEELTKRLTKAGIRVATIKHTRHNHSFDIPGKDSDRHRKSGADITLAISNSGFALFGANREKYLNSIKEMMASHFDICFIEGDKFSDKKKILLTRNIKELSGDVPGPIIATYGSEARNTETIHFDSKEISDLTEFLMTKYISDNKDIENAK